MEIKIIKDNNFEKSVLSPIREFKITDKTSILLDSYFNYYLKALVSKIDNEKTLDKVYSIVPISKDEKNGLLEGSFTVDQAFSGNYFSARLEERFDKLIYNTDRKVEIFSHG